MYITSLPTQFHLRLCLIMCDFCWSKRDINYFVSNTPASTPFSKSWKIVLEIIVNSSVAQEFI